MALCLFLLVGCGAEKPSETKEEPTETTIQTEPEPEKKPEPPPPPPPPTSPFSGVETTLEKLERRPLAVMFDNQPKARPQAGMSKAEIVVEMRIEGEFTRYMGVFLIEDPPIIGPVRSARPYFIRRAQEFGAVFAHFGGSGEALNMIKKEGIETINGIYLDGTTYYRNKNVGKRPPHNAYTSTELLREKAADYGYGFESVAEGYDFGPGREDGAEATKFSIKYHETVRYVYDEGKYRRYIGEKEQVDEDGGAPIAPTNVVVQYAEAKVIDSDGHLRIDQVGEGTGLLFQKGKMREITWRKDHELALTKFFETDGAPVQFVPGQTWIQVVGEGRVTVEEPAEE